MRWDTELRTWLVYCSSAEHSQYSTDAVAVFELGVGEANEKQPVLPLVSGQRSQELHGPRLRHEPIDQPTTKQSYWNTKLTQRYTYDLYNAGILISVLLTDTSLSHVTFVTEFHILYPNIVLNIKCHVVNNMPFITVQKTTAKQKKDKWII